MTSIVSYTNRNQCQAQEFYNSGNEETAATRFRQAAESLILTFLRGHRLPAEEASDIFFNIEPSEGDEFSIQIEGNIPEGLLIALKNQLLNIAINLGVCEFDYNPSTPPEEDDYEEPESPRVAQRREAPPEEHLEVRLGEASLEVQTPPPPPPVDEATRTPVPPTKEPQDTFTMMDEDNYSMDRIVLPDGKVMTIYIAPGIERVDTTQ
jgi:hypothetical protein